MAKRDATQDPVYDFEHLGEKLASSLLRAAEDQVTEAQNIYEQTKVLTEGIRAQVLAQSKALEDINNRLKAFGSSMLDAHRKYLNGHAADPQLLTNLNSGPEEPVLDKVVN